MRLTCPECDARYDVEASLIPPEGRAVECARCGHRWHQPGEEPAPILLGDPDIAPEVEVEAPPPAAPRPSAAVLDILREEAQRELAQRAADRARNAGGAAPAVTDEPRKEEIASVSGAVSSPGESPEPPSTRRTAAGGATRPVEPELIEAELIEDRERPRIRDLPDPEALAASLHWQPPPRAAVAGARRGYDAGFGLVAALAALAVAAYVAAPHVEGTGTLGQSLGQYRREADRARLWLHDRIAPPTDRAIEAITGSDG